MDTSHPTPHAALRAAQGRRLKAPATPALLGALLALTGAPALAQTPTDTPPGAEGWQRCALIAGDAERLACFDGWSQRQRLADTPVATTPQVRREITASPGALASEQPAVQVVDTTLPATRIITVSASEGCRDHQYSDLSRFWELEGGSDCGTFGLRGYRPTSLSVIGSDSVNTQPSSPSAGHTPDTAVPYKRTEMRVQLSVRTKIAQGLLTQSHPTLRDSLWFGYTQQSYWQIFSPAISRPFRSTDHEPEFMYVYPTEARLPGGWKWRYSGVGIVHQSNGQSLPLSRSWNRVYLMTGLEQGDRWRVQARIWRRIPESAANDDNPDISHFVGRGELSAFWHLNRDNTLGATVRHSLGSTAHGSVRLEWLQALASESTGGKSGLRLHTQLFSGYGDSLVDYNRRRTVFSVGLSLVDF